MFHLFRRHQKALLTTVAVIAIGSMALSAIVPLFMDQDQKLAQQGPLSKDIKEAFLKLIDHSLDACNDKLVFPESLFTQAIIDTGIFIHVADTIKQTANSQIDEVYEKIASYTPWEMSVGQTYHDVIAKIAPSLHEVMVNMKKAHASSYEEKIALMNEFFKQKKALPLPLVYQYMQAMNNTALSSYEDLAPFGLKTIEDCIGDALAKECTKEFIKAFQAQAALENSTHVMQKYQSMLSKFYAAQVHPHQFLAACGIDPKVGFELLKMIESVSSVKKQIKDLVLIDPSYNAQIYEYATHKVPVNCYSFMKQYQPSSLEDALLQELYIKEQNQFVFDSYQIKVRSVEKKDAVAKMPKKQLYQEALDSYSKLSALLPYALSSSLNTDKEKLDAIKNLNGQSKALFDEHMQKIIVKNQPQFFQKYLEQETVTTKQIFLSKTMTKCPLEGFASCEQLKTELDMLPFNTAVVFDLGDTHMYEIELVSKTLNPEPISFDQALESGILKQKLKNQLEVLFKEQIKKNPSKFFTTDKRLKTFDEAFYDMVEIAAKDLKKKLASALDLNEEAPSRLLVKAYPKLVLKQALKTRENADFRLEKSQAFLERHKINDMSLTCLFESTPSVTSEVVLNETGSYVFYEKTGDIEPQEPFLKQDSLDRIVLDKLKQNTLERL